MLGREWLTQKLQTVISAQFPDKLEMRERHRLRPWL
jgi:hypothetical protein